MTATVMDGEALATRIKADLATRIVALAERGITPGLGTVLVGDDGPSHKYVSMKHADCAALGISSRDVRLPATATQAEVEAAVAELNADPSIDAFILQYPFPAGLDYDAAVLAVDPAKDADGLHPVNLGKLVMGAPAPLACTPHGIVKLLEAHDVALAGAHVVIVGRGLTIGRPLANLMTLKHGPNAAVTVVRDTRRASARVVARASITFTRHLREPPRTRDRGCRAPRPASLVAGCNPRKRCGWGRVRAFRHRAWHRR